MCVSNARNSDNSISVSVSTDAAGTKSGDIIAILDAGSQYGKVGLVLA